MKPVKPILFFAYTCCLLSMMADSATSSAQCTSGVKTSTYSVILNGTGNNSWGFVFPQFDPTQGTLTSVVIKSVVSVNVNFQLQNTGTSQFTYGVNALRDDSMSVNAMSTPITNLYSQSEGPYTLQANGDTVGAGTNTSPQYYALLSAHVISDSITAAVAGFLGTGYVTFNYDPSTFVTVSSDSNASITTVISDTMKVSMVYYYCTTNILSLTNIDFNVQKAPGNLAKLTWQKADESSGNLYVVQESNDGKDFDSVGAEPSVIQGDQSGNYLYNYGIPAGSNGLLYFRIKEIASIGQESYSEVKSILVGNGQSASLYPNPASDLLHITFNETSVSGWEISMYAADGRLVQQNDFIMGPSAQLNMLGKLARGAYFLRIINKDNQKVTTFPVVLR